MNWYKKNIKTASVLYLYHGTGIQNLNTILSQGLNPEADKLYNEDFDNHTLY